MFVVSSLFPFRSVNSHLLVNSSIPASFSSVCKLSPKLLYHGIVPALVELNATRVKQSEHQIIESKDFDIVVSANDTSLYNSFL